MANAETTPFQPVTPAVIQEAKALLRTARHGVLAVLDPATGGPLASRVGLVTGIDGTPAIIASALSAHTAALQADPRCSLLVGEPGSGDPLAHARLAVTALAREVPRDGDNHRALASRHLRHQPKARIYIDLPDFRYFELEPQTASLNGGFGRASRLSGADLLTHLPANAVIAAAEGAAVEHMNEDHADAVELIARHFGGLPAGRWRLAGIDAEGLAIAQGDGIRRVAFARPLQSADDVHHTLVAMTGEARSALG